MKYIIESHEFFSESLRALTPECVARIWGVRPRQAYNYASDPACCVSATRDPLRRLLDQLEHLKAIDRLNVMEAGLKYLAEPLGYNVRENEVTTNRFSACREFLDVNEEIGKMSCSIQELLEESGVEESFKRKLLRQADEAIRQLEKLKDAVRKGLK